MTRPVLDLVHCWR